MTRRRKYYENLIMRYCAPKFGKVKIEKDYHKSWLALEDFTIDKCSMSFVLEVVSKVRDLQELQHSNIYDCGELEEIIVEEDEENQILFFQNLLEIVVALKMGNQDEIADFPSEPSIDIECFDFDEIKESLPLYIENDEAKYQPGRRKKLTLKLETCS
ncbi:hypothetical protein Patl1_04197 [Pistacia atlantica]|uniref:Uncharacterized protein n=1 Tax=Pistacia atlantica TaxID=434234 RepID=A0ACC1BSD0_9ROSI|nr:hypothetical protein Patl1_04197 [Pistacia atlantica]